MQRITINLTDKAAALLEQRVAAARAKNERASRSSVIEECLLFCWGADEGNLSKRVVDPWEE